MRIAFEICEQWLLALLNIKNVFVKIITIIIVIIIHV